MTLTAHAIVGAAIVAAMPAHPELGVCAAFASHFLVDAIPHWNYEPRSPSIHPAIRAPMKFDRLLLTDFFFIGGDALLGLILAVLFFATPSTLVLIVADACAGELPDTLHFAYTRFPREPLTSVERFHGWIQPKSLFLFKGRPLTGVASQALCIAVFVALARMYLF